MHERFCFRGKRCTTAVHSFAKETVRFNKISRVLAREREKGKATKSARRGSLTTVVKARASRTIGRKYPWPTLKPVIYCDAVGTSAMHTRYNEMFRDDRSFPLAGVFLSVTFTRPDYGRSKLVCIQIPRVLSIDRFKSFTLIWPRLRLFRARDFGRPRGKETGNRRSFLPLCSLLGIWFV